MASRFLKATGNWADNNTWSETDGGAAGATFPVAGDDVFITANGNGLTLTLAAAAACNSITCSGSNTATLAGTETITVGGNATLLATMTVPNTITFTVTGTGNFAGSTLATLGAINLNGTAHTVSGAFTCTVLTRNGTATKTDTLTLTSGTTLTCTTFAMIGNSSVNRLLVQSSTLGTAATVTATNWTGTVNVDIMDITATNAVDLSAITGLSGDAQGNTNITFTTTATQTSGTTDTWSTSGGWTSRVPLPQDDVTCSHSKTVDMPRIGKSITFTGTPTITLGVDISNYGSFTLVSGMTYTHSSYANFFRGRGTHTITSATKHLYRYNIYAPTGTYTLLDAGYSDATSNVIAGTIDFNDLDTTFTQFSSAGSIARTINMGNGTLTISGTNSPNFNGATNLTFNAEGSTILISLSGEGSPVFSGNGYIYNNVTVSGAGNYTLTVTGNNTFNVIDIDASAAIKTVKFAGGSTQTLSNLTRDAGTNQITIDSTNATPFNLVFV